LKRSSKKGVCSRLRWRRRRRKVGWWWEIR